ncbi:MAG: cyclopropane-fatty-acyl-phospholipid synthase family protein [Solirubrobacterales bacterium]|nr:cyclopropane-fatty-acyl-phospholipid synthase family protein [Solirubrobacterales bacterium]
MYSTGGVAERFVPIWSRAEARLGGPLPAAVRFWDGSELGSGTRGSATDTVVLRSPKALAYAAGRPDQLGLARAFVSGELELEGDIERVMAAGARMYGFDISWRDKLEAVRIAVSVGAVRLPPPSPPESEARVGGRMHSLRRDRQAISHHYDVSNRFYRLILGPTLVYSCAYFESPDDSLEEAQTRKLDVICRKLRLEQGERFLDIGCGWGSLVMHAAANYGVQAVGVTLSEAQAELARERIREAGLGDRCEIRIQDYREVGDGPYDKIASVGMFEHVGSSMLDRYMETVAALGRPGGLALHHGICRQHSNEESPNTFITHYVFPDGELHRVAKVIRALERSGQELRDTEALREHYALTLRHWVRNLASNPELALAEVGAERRRIWELYMTASALAFERGDISVQQMLAVLPEHEQRPLYRPSPGIELARPTFVAPAGSLQVPTEDGAANVPSRTQSA